jgi:thiol-disulfide isomerase/thioredoxin
MKRCLAGLLLGALWSVSAAGPLPQGMIALDGRAAPALKLADLDGRATDLDRLRGRWVMVHFWAGWCGPCRQELPAIQRMRRALGPAGPTLVMVNTAETDDEVFAFLSVVAPELTSLLDRDGLVTARWQPRGLPSTFLVDPQGRQRYLALGGRAWDSPEYLGFLRSLDGVVPAPAQPGK